MAVRFSISSAQDANPRFIKFDALNISIGREFDCDLRLPFSAVSGYHCTVYSEDGQNYWIRDDGSTNGTRLNGRLLNRDTSVKLNPNSCIRVGDIRLDVDFGTFPEEAAPVAHTRTLMRMMLNDGQAQSDVEADQARLVVTRGPDKGHTSFLPVEFDSLLISADSSAFLVLPKLETSLEITPHDDGFAIEMLGDAGTSRSSRRRVAINNQPLEGKYQLASDDLIRVGRVELRFIDPLEEMLLELNESIPIRPDDPPPCETTPHPGIDESIIPGHSDSSEPAAQQHPTDNASDRAPVSATQQGTWSLFEVLFLASTLIMVVAVTYLFYLMLT